MNSTLQEHLTAGVTFGLSTNLIVCLAGSATSLFLLYLSVKHWQEIREGGSSKVTLFLVILCDAVYNIFVGSPTYLIQLARNRLLDSSASDSLCFFNGFFASWVMACSLVAIVLCSAERYQTIIQGKKPQEKIYVGVFLFLVLNAFVLLLVIIPLGITFEPTKSGMNCTPHHRPDPKSTVPAVYYYAHTSFATLSMLQGVTLLGFLYARIYFYIKKVTKEAAKHKAIELSKPANNFQSKANQIIAPLQNDSSISPDRIVPHLPRIVTAHSRIAAEEISTPSVGPTGMNGSRMENSPNDLPHTTNSTYQQRQRDSNIFYKIVLIAVTSITIWTPVVVLMALDVLLKVNIPPSISGIVTSIATAGPLINNLLILKHITHYRRWSIDSLQPLKRRFLRT